jgi:hypothetical protein
MISLVGILSIAIIPYLFYYKRERVFLDKIQIAFDKYDKQIQKKEKEYREISELVANPFAK